MELNTIELAILAEIANYNAKQYPFVKVHLPYLRVKSRKRTGVGVYVYFEYVSVDKLIFSYDTDYLVLSSDRKLMIDGLKYGLNYEINIIDGKFDFLEIVTNGETWDGEFGDFEFQSVQ